MYQPKFDPDVKLRVIRGAEMLVEERTSIRSIARRFGVTSSTIYKDFYKRLPFLDPRLALHVRYLLSRRRRHRKGAAARERAAV